jgi:YARHG domain
MRFILLFFALCLPAQAIGVREANSMSCDDLYLERNEIYKERGYCFKTPLAIRTFGNAGCRYDDVRDVPLSGQDRTRINALLSAEKRKQCQ